MYSEQPGNFGSEPLEKRAHSSAVPQSASGRLASNAAEEMKLLLTAALL
eukprot:COSAG06_NODE_226_length_19747_cov_9.234121_8_plen_49_part_00